MEKQALVSRAEALGFSRVDFLPPTPAAPHKNPARLPLDPRAQLPEAASVVVLTRAYTQHQPLPGEPPLSCYYLASNLAYHAARTLAKEFALVPAKLPVKSLLADANIGTFGKNGLLEIPPFGSYVTFQVLLSAHFPPDAPLPTRNPTHLDPRCAACQACTRACPAGAISATQDASRCVRGALDGTYPGYSSPAARDTLNEAAAAQVRELVGCEACQRCCPRNAALPVTPMPAEVARVFTLAALLTPPFDDDPLRALIGPNRVRHGHPRAYALCAAANLGRGEFAPGATLLLASEYPLLRAAAAYYLRRTGIKA